MSKKYDQPTPQERALIHALTEAGVEVDVKRRFSYTSNSGKTRYIKPDISIPSIKLCIEVDGGGHGTVKGRERDRKRDATIRSHNWKVVHVENDIVNNYKKCDKLVQGIVEQAKARVVEEKPKRGNKCATCNRRIKKRYTHCLDCNNNRQKPKRPTPKKKRKKYSTKKKLLLLAILLLAIFLWTQADYPGSWEEKKDAKKTCHFACTISLTSGEKLDDYEVKEVYNQYWCHCTSQKREWEAGVIKGK